MFNRNKIKSLFGHFLNDKDPSEILEELTPPKEEKETEKKPVIKKNTEDDFNIEQFLKDTPRAQLLFESLFSIKQKEYYYSRRLAKIEQVKTRTDLVNLISQDFPEFIGTYEKGVKKGNRFFTIDSLFFTNCFFENTIETVVRQTDLFQKEKIMIEKIGTMLFIKKNTLNFIKPKALDVSDEIYNEIVSDYLQHFKELPNILEWIVACRFTNNRRQSYLHLKIPAGFGKSFFIGILSSLGMIAKCRYDDFKSPSSLKPQEFENSLSMIIDEFTVFKKEFKDYTNTMILDPKYELRTEVQLFSKIFLSAESSNSFSGGVDAQITDRMNVIDKSNSVKLDYRDKYMQYGNMLYFNCMKHYIYKTITDKIEYYIQQGELESSNQAEQVLKNFYKKHKLNAENIVDAIKVNFYTKIYELFDADEYDLINTDAKIKKNIITTLDYIHIKQVKSTFEDIIKCFGEDFYKKARYKVNNFEEMFHLENKNYKVDGKTIRCARIDKANLINLFENHSDNLMDNIDLIEPPF